MIGAWVLTTVLAATPISLEQVRELSRKNTAALLQQVAIFLANEQYRTARAPILPQLTLGSRVGEIFTGPQVTVQNVPTGVDPDTNRPILTPTEVTVPGRNVGQFNASITLTQLLFDGGKWWNAIAQGGAQEDAAQGQFADQVLTSEYEGIRRFYQLYLAQETLNQFEATMRRSEDQANVAQALFEAGRSPKSDAIAAVVNLGNDRITAIVQKGTIANAQSDLAVWILRAGDDDLVAQEPRAMQSGPSRAPSLESAIQVARQRRPLIKSLADRARAADLGVSIARGGNWPTLNAQGQYARNGTSFDPTFTRLNRQNSLQVSLNLTWNLFSGFATDSAIKTALHNRTLAELNLIQAQRDLEGDVRRSLRSLEAQLEAFGVAKTTLQAARDGLMLAEERFKAGAGSTLEVRDAQLKRTQSELSVIRTRVDAETARANLERVTGSLSPGG